MKKLSFFEKFLFLINTLIAFSFLISLCLPHIKPTLFSYFAIFSLFTPIIISLNILFMFFWIAKLKKQFILSLIVLLLGNDSLKSFVNFSNNSKFIGYNEFSIISYNVRLFNIYNWIEKDNVTTKIKDFLKNNCLPNNNIGYYEMPSERSIDIDKKEDLIEANKLIIIQKN